MGRGRRRECGERQGCVRGSGRKRRLQDDGKLLLGVEVVELRVVATLLLFFSPMVRHAANSPCHHVIHIDPAFISHVFHLSDIQFTRHYPCASRPFIQLISQHG